MSRLGAPHPPLHRFHPRSHSPFPPAALPSANRYLPPTSTSRSLHPPAPTTPTRQPLPPARFHPPAPATRSTAFACPRLRLPTASARPPSHPRLAPARSYPPLWNPARLHPPAPAASTYRSRPPASHPRRRPCPHLPRMPALPAQPTAPAASPLRKGSGSASWSRTRPRAGRRWAGVGVADVGAVPSNRAKEVLTNYTA